RRQATLTGVEQPDDVQVLEADPDLLRILGWRSLQGRLFTGSDKEAVLLSSRYWLSKLGGDPQAVGRSLVLDGQSRLVLGIVSSRLLLPPFEADLVAPLELTAAELKNRRRGDLQVVGRLKESVNLEQAQSDLKGIAAALSEQHKENSGVGVRLVPLQDQIVQGRTLSLLLLQAAAGLVLLICCANVAMLLLSAGHRSRRELAVRMATGAGPWQLLRLSWMRCLILSLAGGIGGLLAAGPISSLLLHWTSSDLPRGDEAVLDGTVAAVTLGFSLLTGLLAGAAPSLRAWRTDHDDVLRQAQSSSQGRSGRLAGRLLVVFETALVMILLVLSGLTVRSLLRLQSVDYGFEPDRVTVAEIQLPAYKYPHSRIELRRDFWSRLLDQARSLPGVRWSAVSSHLPLDGGPSRMPFKIEGQAAPESGSMSAHLQTASPDYFRAMGIPLLSGRAFSPADDSQAGAAIINQAMARLHFAGQDPLGRSIVFLGKSYPIVGVAGDVRMDSLAAEPEPQIYLPYLKHPHFAAAWLILHSTSQSADLAPLIPDLTARIDPQQPIQRIATLEGLVEESAASPRSRALLLTWLGIAALLLALFGIYGVVSDSVMAPRCGDRHPHGAGGRQDAGLGIGPASRSGPGCARRPDWLGRRPGVLEGHRLFALRS
ncbi:MAG: ABC transporter permease, partial [Acidobacteriota bacterium]